MKARIPKHSDNNTDSENNPYLKATLLEVVDNQLNDNDPPETRETLNRLIADGYSEEKAKERIASVLVTHIYEVMHNSKQFDSEKYKRDLALIEDEIKELLKSGMEDIRNANIESGVESITNIANGVKYDTYLDIKNITIYGIEIPSAVHNKEIVRRNYGFFNTSSSIDEAIFEFNKLQEKLIEYAILENTIYRLKKEIIKVRKRSNALENIIIPRDENILKQIADELEERDREEFSRLKVVKKNLNN